MSSGKWDIANWSKTNQGVSILEAFGISKGKVSFPPLNAQLPAQAAQANQGSKGATGGGAGNPSGNTEAANQKLGQQMALAQPYNWGGDQWTALNNIVMAESGWSTTAANPSGAYGIPQALPGSKMASAGSDWQTDPRTQIAWMLQYIQQRYGTPQAAWQFHLANGWY